MRRTDTCICRYLRLNKIFHSHSSNSRKSNAPKMKKKITRGGGVFILGIYKNWYMYTYIIIIMIENSAGIIIVQCWIKKNPGRTKHVCNLRWRSIISKLEKSLYNMYISYYESGLPTYKVFFTPLPSSLLCTSSHFELPDLTSLSSHHISSCLPWLFFLPKKTSRLALLYGWNIQQPFQAIIQPNDVQAVWQILEKTSSKFFQKLTSVKFHDESRRDPLKGLLSP